MKILITAGPTREAIDAVRFLTNRSTGKMGYALAAEAARRGHVVTLISGPVNLPPPDGVTTLAVESAAEMARAVHGCAADCDLIVMAAAVADYRPVHRLAGKLKKGDGPLTLELERTEDILKTLGETKRPGQILVGFAAETDDLERYAQEKLARKHLDWIAANDVSRSDRGFGSAQNAVTLFARDGRRFDLPLADKSVIARRILELVGA